MRCSRLAGEERPLDALDSKILIPPTLDRGCNRAGTPDDFVAGSHVVARSLIVDRSFLAYARQTM